MRPLILVTNDDGVMAPGLKALASVMNETGDVFLIAPDKPQSGTGHAITINSAVKVEKVNLYGCRKEYSCSGTPVDCVKVAVHKIMQRMPDLCVSGINHGSNSSINVIYSGTMSAALEGAIEGIPSVGFSLCNTSLEADFSAALKFVKIISANVLRRKLPEGVCLNVNIPAITEKKIKGIKICRQARAYWKETYEERKDKNGNVHFWLTGQFENRDKRKTTDEWALAHNFVSVVPVHFDVTAHTALPSLQKWNINE